MRIEDEDSNIEEERSLCRVLANLVQAKTHAGPRFGGFLPSSQTKLASSATHLLSMCCLWQSLKAK